MANVIKGILLATAILYFISPVDACPGPIDDIIVLVLSFVTRKGIDLIAERKKE